MPILSGAPALASDVNDAIGITLSDTQNTTGTTTSTSYTATLTGGTACGFAFTAPSSGKVLIYWALNMFNSGAFHGFASPRVRTGGSVGSGSDVLVPADANASHHGLNVAERFGCMYLLTGLTAGSTYNVQLLHRVEGGTGTFNSKHLILTPQL